jgi:hypothetical protein
MSCVPPIVVPPSVLRLNWKTLVRLASRWSKPPDLDVCPALNYPPVSFVVQPTNCCLLDFEAQIGKSDDLGFEAQSRNSYSSSSYAWYRSHTTLADLSIVRSPSIQPVLDHLWSSASGLLLLPWSSSLPIMSHLSSTHHETSKRDSPHEQE